MSALRVVPATLLAAALTAGLVALSRVPYTAVSGDAGELRLAWRWRSERVERCRRPSAEELARLPQHMRAAVSCERRLRPYLLEVWLDGRRVIADSVRATGARADRPLSVFRRFPLEPGRYALRVAFSPVIAAGVARDSQAAPPPPLVLETRAVVAPRQVVLITTDEDAAALVARIR